jgi:uncharacterized membrane protein
MPLEAVLLVVGAAFCHGTWNLLLKSSPRRLELWPRALTVGLLLTSVVLFIYPIHEVPALGWTMIVLSGLFETGYVFALSAAYGAGDLSLVYPIARGTAPIVVTPLAVMLLGERPSLAGLTGIALVVAGIGGSYAGGLRAATMGGHRQAVGLAVLTGIMTAGYSLVNKIGVRLVPVPLYGFLVFLVNVVCLLLVLGWRGQLSLGGPGQWPRVVVVGVLMMASYLAVLLAMALAPVSYVVAAREISIVVGAVLGVMVLGEREAPARIAGAVVIFLGLLVLAGSR